MKRVIASLMTASLLAFTPVAPTHAAGDPASGNTGVVDQCKSELGLYPGENQGDCVSLKTTAPKYFAGTGGAGFLAHICEFYMTSVPDDFYAAYSSYNECILDGASNL